MGKNEARHEVVDCGKWIRKSAMLEFI